MIKFSAYAYHRCDFYRNLPIISFRSPYTGEIIRLAEVLEFSNSSSMLFDFEGNSYVVGNHSTLVGEYDVA